MAKKTVKIEEYRNKIIGILEGLGVGTSDAALTADVLLDADICGPESHGMAKLSSYTDRLKAGVIKARPQMRDEISGATARVDGDNGLGAVVTQHAAELVMKLADQYGIGCVTVSHSNHFGAAAYYTKQMAEAGYIGFVSSVAGPTVAPFGGMDLLLGTNPFSFSFPGEETGFCTDMATSAAAKGKIRIYAQKGLPIPRGWALDAQGNDTTDPNEAIKGIMLPMGGHKGYAIAMIVDALSALLSGAALSHESTPVVDCEHEANTGHFLMAIKISHFLPEEQFRERAQNWFDTLRSSRTRPGYDKIMIPGQPEAERKAATKDTIDVLEGTLDKVDSAYNLYAKK